MGRIGQRTAMCPRAASAALRPLFRRLFRAALQLRLPGPPHQHRGTRPVDRFALCHALEPQ
eukprot:70114-Alexandrium_andersonii.AAC.1